MNVLVSFVIAAYNVEEFVEACLESCQNQTYFNIEISIVDDGSVDGTLEKITTFNRNSSVRVVVDSFVKNRGKVAAFNRAFENAHGDYIAIMCADDICQPDRIQKSLHEMMDYDALCGDLCRFDSYTGQVLTTSLMRDYLSIDSDREFSFEELLLKPSVYGPTLFFKRSVAEDIFPVDECLTHEDWWIPLMLAKKKSIKYLHQVLVRYRVHKDQDTSIVNRFSSFSYWRYFRTREIYYYEKVLRSFEVDNQISHVIQNRINRQRLADTEFFVRLKAFFSLKKRNLIDFVTVLHPYLCYRWMKRKLL